MREFIVAQMGKAVLVQAERPEGAITEAVKQEPGFMPWAGMPVSTSVPVKGYESAWPEDRDHWVCWFKDRCITLSAEKL